MYYSIIIPVYNRPFEVDELLESLTKQTYKDFEVVIVEDGSKYDCKHIVDKYTDRLNIQYHVKENGGPGMARNFGVEKSNGEYMIILDSDVIVPEKYMEAVDRNLYVYKADVFCAPDEADPAFTDEQKAISYAMTSPLTTGGIRNRKRTMDRHYPRSFNMGIRKEVFQKVGGFSKMRFGEDIELGARLYRAGYNTMLFEDAFVYHKRRTHFRQFYKQVYNSGIARINLYKKYPETLKAVHFLPAIFTLSLILWVLSNVFQAVVVNLTMLYYNLFLDISIQSFSFFREMGYLFNLFRFLNFIESLQTIYVALLFIYLGAIFVTSAVKNGFVVGLLSVPASLIQLCGYGLGFIKAYWKRCVKKEDEFTAFKNTFYD
ncbi:MAG: glycosyltransferase [Bacteroides sp.]|nr:glycosyltransferase [Bacteroides sp.]